MKNRKQLPSFGYIDNVQFDVGKILSHLKSNDLLNFDNYNDIKVSSNSKHKDFVISNNLVNLYISHSELLHLYNFLVISFFHIHGLILIQKNLKIGLIWLVLC